MDTGDQVHIDSGRPRPTWGSAPREFEKLVGIGKVGMTDIGPASGSRYMA